jgi:hypothetical protein
MATYMQAGAAEQQNQISMRGQLVALVADISRSRTTAQEATLTYQEDEARLREAIEAISLTRSLQAEEAAAIIDALPPEIVGSTEYFIVAVALEEASRDQSTPLRYLDRAAKNALSPHSRANALRESAKLLYRLGGPANIAAAEQKMEEAKNVFDGVSFTTVDDRDAELAYTLLFDAQFQVRIDCQKAKDEFAEAQRITARGPDVTTTGSATLLDRLPPLLAQC